MNKRFVLTLLACVLAMAGIFWFTRDNSSTTGNGNGGDEAQLTNHVTGSESAGITLVEYGDFECPACLSYFPIIEQVREKYAEQMKFQFRHFPLSQIHPNAFAAHRAAEAAAAQDKFWDMYQLLYQNQTTWSAQAGLTTTQAASQFEGYAEQLNLDKEKFKSDVASSKTSAIINADKAEGDKLEVSSTPTFFLNGEKLEDVRADVTWFSERIDKLIADKQPAAQ